YFLSCVLQSYHDTATTDIYTLSLHDALPIWQIVNDDVVIAAQTIFDDMSEQTGVIEIAVQYETGPARLPDREIVADDFIFAAAEMAEVVAHTGHETLEIESVEKKIMLNGIAVLNIRSRLTHHLGR